MCIGKYCAEMKKKIEQMEFKINKIDIEYNVLSSFIINT